MPKYSAERKEAILRKVLPPLSRSVREVALEQDIHYQTIYAWMKEVREKGFTVPDKPTPPAQWSDAEKFSVVVETASFSEAELSQYCREKGLYVEQVHTWKAECMQGFKNSKTQQQEARKQAQADKKAIKQLKRELRQKEKALAETAALLVLRKKPQCALGRRRGALTPLSERKKLVGFIDEAYQQGARREMACLEVGISLRTYRRWTPAGRLQEDKRPTAIRPAPPNKLTEQEREQIIEVCNSPKYASLPPSQIVPALLDEGRYIASVSTYYRVLKQANQLHHRGRSRAPGKVNKPTTYTAENPNEVWSWDITYCASTVRGQYFYLYMIVDIYSRKIVGYEVHEQECGQKAAELLQRTCWREHTVKSLLVLHSDNGAPMKSVTMKAKMEELGVTPSYNRPRVSNDNPFSESTFRTLKYRPDWPSHGFKNLDEARSWVQTFVGWYNEEHKHSRIKFVTPSQRHQGLDGTILADRRKVLEAARTKRPQRWSGEIQNLDQVGAVTLNPEREVKEAA
nr:IS3 family transposase [Thalassomonas viridans]